MPLVQKKEETYNFRRAKGLVLMRELRDFATFVGRKLGFKVSATGVNMREIAGGIHFDVKAGAGGDSTFHFFQLIDATADGTPFIRVVGSNLDGSPPAFPSAVTGFSSGDDPPCIFAPTTATGVLYAHVEIDSSGSIITRALDFAETLPAEDDTNAYFQIGSWTMTDGVITAVANDAYGPLAVEVCRNWFSNPVTYGITITGAA